MKKMAFLLSSVCFVAVLGGCAANVTQTNVVEARPLGIARAASPATRTHVAVVLTANDALKHNADWASLENDWKELLPDTAAEVKTNATFAASESAVNQSQTVLVRVKVNDFRYISTARRFLMGVLAGNAYMDLDVEYVQLPSMQVLGTKKINTSSSAWEGIFSAVTPKQVYAVSRVVLQDAASMGN